jgi:fructosamine-3-kinase
MAGIEFLAAGLEGAGLPVAKLDAVTRGSFSLTGVAALRDDGHVFAALHTSTVSGRFGWHCDGWPLRRRMRQHNSWKADGHEFHTRHRIQTA